jgi:hypothetical protein
MFEAGFYLVVTITTRASILPMLSFFLQPTSSCGRVTGRRVVKTDDGCVMTFVLNSAQCHAMQ